MICRKASDHIGETLALVRQQVQFFVDGLSSRTFDAVEDFSQVLHYVRIGYWRWAVWGVHCKCGQQKAQAHGDVKHS